MVGSVNQKAFTIHRNLLRTSSDFLTKALDEVENRHLAQTIALPFVDTDIFEIYMKWLYSGRLCIRAIEQVSVEEEDEGQNEDESQDEDDFVPDQEYNVIHDCYALAAKIQDDDFKDSLIDAVMVKLCEGSSCSMITPRTIYGHSPKGSAHRQFSVDCSLNFWDSDDRAQVVQSNFPKEFKNDLFLAMSDHLRDALVAANASLYFEALHPCAYHEHGDDKCYKDEPRFMY